MDGCCLGAIFICLGLGCWGRIVAGVEVWVRTSEESRLLSNWEERSESFGGCEFMELPQNDRWTDLPARVPKEEQEHKTRIGGGDKMSPQKESMGLFTAGTRQARFASLVAEKWPFTGLDWFDYPFIRRTHIGVLF